MKVAVAVIYDDQQRVLITRRPLHATHGGMWEFPGGKLEQDESAFTALVREIKEEVDLDVLEADFLNQISYQYTQHAVDLLVYAVRSFQGQARCCEQQIDLKWVDLDALSEYVFPEANLAILNLLQREVRLSLQLANS